jgi:hypothetical protein
MHKVWSAHGLLLLLTLLPRTSTAAARRQQQRASKRARSALVREQLGGLLQHTFFTSDTTLTQCDLAV